MELQEPLLVAIVAEGELLVLHSAGTFPLASIKTEFVLRVEIKIVKPVDAPAKEAGLPRHPRLAVALGPLYVRLESRSLQLLFPFGQVVRLWLLFSVKQLVHQREFDENFRPESQAELVVEASYEAECRRLQREEMLLVGRLTHLVQGTLAYQSDGGT